MKEKKNNWYRYKRAG